VTSEPVRITVVTAPGCHLCDDARAALDVLAADHPLEVAVVDARSSEGLELLSVHRAAMNPLVVVDGRFFSSGRLPRGKLHALLESRAETALTGAGHG